MTVKKAKPTKKKSAKKKKAAKKPVRKRASKASVPRPYVPPKRADELGIVCSTLAGENPCGAAVVWFDYAIGEKDFRRGFVCNEHRISNRVEKLAVKQAASVTA